MLYYFHACVLMKMSPIIILKSFMNIDLFTISEAVIYNEDRVLK
jgi:hypothetical protein